MNKNRPEGMNIELTTRCPLQCPQCYCTLEGGRDIPVEIAINRLKEAAKLGVKHVELSGGETLCYSHLFDVVAAAHSFGISPSIAISGWGFDETVLAQLKDAGIDMICVSLNGPTKEENEKSRDGYDYAIQALKVLQKDGFKKILINWVMHRASVALLPQMIELAETYNVSGILIIEPKPTAKGEWNTYPTLEQMRYVTQLIRNNNGNVDLIVQHCFSSLLALSCDNKLWGNLNRGPYKGCTAGLCSYCVDVEGLYTPCRHLDYHESFDTAEEYWHSSKVLKRLREIDQEYPAEPCGSCRFKKYCRPCAAINSKLEGKLYRGNHYCPIHETNDNH